MALKTLFNSSSHIRCVKRLIDLANKPCSDLAIEKSELIEAIGHPDKIDTDVSENHLLIYNELRCAFWIGDDARLHWIQSTNPNVVLFGRLIVGIPIETTISEIGAGLKAQLEREDYGAMDSYAIDSHELELELELQAEYGVVRTICFGNY